MPTKSIWESDLWKTIVAISVILTIIASFLTVLHLFGNVDVHSLLILPIINFFTIPIPLYSIPLTFLVGLAILFVLVYTSGSNSVSISNPLAGMDVLDDDCVRYLVILCKTPRTPNFLKKKYRECRYKNRFSDGYLSDEILKELEDRDLLIFQNGKWEVTKKALDYIAKYHSSSDNL